jgi:hypothetical protein
VGLLGPAHRKERDLCIVDPGSKGNSKSRSDSQFERSRDGEVSKNPGGEGVCIKWYQSGIFTCRF